MKKRSKGMKKSKKSCHKSYKSCHKSYTLVSEAQKCSISSKNASECSKGPIKGASLPYIVFFLPG